MRSLWPVLLLCLTLSGCTRIFLHPDRYDYAPDRPLGVPAEDVWIAAPDGQQLHALLMPAQGQPKATLLFLHGNAENLSTHARIMTWLPAQGYAVLALDYRGFGRSQGETGVDEIHEDAEAALTWLVAQGKDKTGALVVYGQSIGASVAIRFAAQSRQREHIAAVIADSPFSSYRGIAREKLGALWLTWPLQWPLSFLISDRYAAIDVVADLSPVPLLLIHGERDFIVPASHSQRLYDAAREPKTLWLIPDGNHIDAPRRDAMRTRLVEFLDGIVAPR